MMAGATGWSRPTAASSRSATPASTGRRATRTCRTAVVGMVASPDGGGYLLATANGVVLAYGDAVPFGGLSLDPTATQISAIIGNNQGSGYWLLDPQAWQYSFTTATPEPEFPQSTGHCGRSGLPDRARPDTQGSYCNPYGPCEQWCALFATWAWEQAGIPIPRYAFTGDMDGWAAAVWRRPAPDGDARRRRRRALRHRAPEHRDVGPRRRS